jgi:hypothetical protein
MAFFLKEDVSSCRGDHPHGEWCLRVVVALTGPNPCTSRSDFTAGLFETPFNSEESAEFAAKVINRGRFGKSMCLSCGMFLSFNGGCSNPKCSYVHESVSEDSGEVRL